MLISERIAGSRKIVRLAEKHAKLAKPDRAEKSEVRRKEFKVKYIVGGSDPTLKWAFSPTAADDQSATDPAISPRSAGVRPPEANSR